MITQLSPAPLLSKAVNNKNYFLLTWQSPGTPQMTTGHDTDPDVHFEHPSLSNFSQVENNSQRLFESGL